MPRATSSTRTVVRRPSTRAAPTCRLPAHTSRRPPGRYLGAESRTTTVPAPARTRARAARSRLGRPSRVTLDPSGRRVTVNASSRSPTGRRVLLAAPLAPMTER